MRRVIVTILFVLVAAFMSVFSVFPALRSSLNFFSHDHRHRHSSVSTNGVMVGFAAESA